MGLEDVFNRDHYLYLAFSLLGIVVMPSLSNCLGPGSLQI